MPQILIEPFWTGPMKIFLLVTNVEGDKAGDERERRGRDAGARSANRQDRMEQKNLGKKGMKEEAV